LWRIAEPVATEEATAESDDDVTDAHKDGDVDPLIGTVLAGRYRVLRLLGRGGMGSVYAAEQAPLKREVALKLLRKDLATDPIAVERFKREAQIVAALGHPHVVGLHDFGADENGSLFIAMELLRGEDLYSRIKRKGPLPWPRVLRIAEQTARALAGAHARGVIHRDLKPANVLLLNVDGVRDFVKVLDFGVAKLVADRKPKKELTGEEIVPGTAGFIAPEVIDASGESDDPRADLYSLGATCFQALTARAPFLADSVVELIMRQMSDDVVAPSSIVDGIPREVDDLVIRLLQRKPGDRPGSAAEVADALAKLDVDLRSRAQALLETLPDDGPESGPSVPIVPATLTSLPRTPHTVAQRGGRRVSIPVAAALFVIVCVATFFAARTFIGPRAAERSDRDPIYFPSPQVPLPPRALPTNATNSAMPLAEPPTSTHASGNHAATTHVSTHERAALVAPPTPPIAAAASVDAGVSATQLSATPKRDPDEPDDDPSGAALVDEGWRAHAQATLGDCEQSCARVVGPRLGTLDLSKVTRNVKDAVDECVAKCARKKP
jgi:serine/threonine-protein kinase